MDAQLHVLSSDTHRKPGRKARLSYRHIGCHRSKPVRSCTSGCPLPLHIPHTIVRDVFTKGIYQSRVCNNATQTTPDITARHTRTLHQSTTTGHTRTLHQSTTASRAPAHCTRVPRQTGHPHTAPEYLYKQGAPAHCTAPPCITNQIQLPSLLTNVYPRW